MDATRDLAIQDAALALLAEVGYDRMTMDAVAARARVSKATIYRRWPGKAELVVDAIGAHHPMVGASCGDTGSLRGDLLDVVRTIARVAGAENARVAGVLLAMRDSPELRAAIREGITAECRHLTDEIVARAVARGEIPAAATGVWLLDSLAPSVLFVRQFFTDQPVDDAFVTALVDDVLVPVLVHAGEHRATGHATRPAQGPPSLPRP